MIRLSHSATSRSRTRRLIDAACHLLILLSVVIISSLLQAAALVFLPFRRRRWVPDVVHFLFRRVLASFWAFFNAAGIIRISYHGSPTQEGRVIFIANHPSFFDALLLIPRLPRTACLYKAALERSFLPRSLAENAGFISNAGSIESIREGVERLRKGWRVLVFPEGTRTASPPMGPWKSSFALMAARAEAPVHFVLVEMNPPLFAKGASWWRPPHYPVRVRVRFGLSMPPPSEHTARNFQRQVEETFRHELIQQQTSSSVRGS